MTIMTSTMGCAPDFHLDDLLTQPFVAEQWRAVEAKHPNAP
jgi:hypothetical protein